MARRSSLWLLVLSFGLSACAHERPQAPAVVPAKTSSAATRQPQSLHEHAWALTLSTIEQYARLGLRIDASKLHLEVASQAQFVDGISENARHFELPGLYDALSATARMVGSPLGRSPAELRVLAPFALGEVTLAYYDFAHKTFVLRDAPDARIHGLDDVVAHELGHAFQDFEQGGIRAYIARHSSSPDSLRAAHSVLEGEATLFAEAVRLAERGLSITVLDPDLADPTVGRLTTGESYSLIYDAGRRFLLSRHRAAGIPGIILGFSQPPSSTEQLLHPEKFGQDLPRAVELPALPTTLGKLEILFDNTLGEMLIFHRLLQLTKSLHEARLAATGWDGDRMRVFRFPNRSYGLQWRIAWDRERDGQQFCALARPKISESPLASIRCDPKVVSLAYAETPNEARILSDSLNSLSPQSPTDTRDATSTAHAEAAYERAEALRPRVLEGRWVWPTLGLSFALPEGFFPISLRGVDILAMMPKDGFANNISVTFEQDLYQGDLARYLADQKRLAQNTSQIWLGARMVRTQKHDAALVELAVPGQPRQASADLLVIRRNNGTLVTITVATDGDQRDLARAIIAAIERSLVLD